MEATFADPCNPAAGFGAYIDGNAFAFLAVAPITSWVGLKDNDNSKDIGGAKPRLGAKQLGQFRDVCRDPSRLGALHTGRCYSTRVRCRMVNRIRGR
jgi:hypothetical protein